MKQYRDGSGLIVPPTAEANVPPQKSPKLLLSLLFFSFPPSAPQ
jgi:hypothetical protein